MAGGPWIAARKDQSLPFNTRLRTLSQSAATLRLADKSELILSELSTVEIQAPPAQSRAQISFLKGLFYLFTRDAPGETPFSTPHVAGGHRGTELEVRVAEDRTVVTVLDGEVGLTNAAGFVVVPTLRRAEAVGNQRPQITAVIGVTNLVQWWLYYPAVLHVDELKFGDQEAQLLRDSIEAYRSGELVKALQLYPQGRQPQSEKEKLFYASLILSVGQVQQAEELLEGIRGGALRLLIAAVNHRTIAVPTPPMSASESLALSYYEQSRTERRDSLDRALAAAKAAREKAPSFGYAWARVAELEFSFGRLGKAEEALKEGLRLSPRNPQALALRGFVLSGKNRIQEAIGYFEQAIDIDPALPTAWLGRGLCRIKRGEIEKGRADIQKAVVLQSNQSLLHSYLGKAYAIDNAQRPAEQELEYATRLDPNDPTPWLYLALLHRDENRINEAVRQLERSQELNDNRSLFRSQLLLDQDRGVRSANLASIYYDAGMVDVSVREAVRAVNSDYANFSAHLFLANSFDRLRDPTMINLRFETPAFSEYLVANLLAPVGAGTLSPTISQQEYSKLFERNGLGFTSLSEYWSRGDWAVSGSQYGTFGNTSYAVEGAYRSERGDRPNNDLERKTFSQLIRQQLTPQDTVYFQAIEQYSKGGNLIQYYRPSDAQFDPVRFREEQEPIVLAGYHRSWTPGVDTLFLFSRVENTFDVRNEAQLPLFLIQNGGPGNLAVVEAGIFGSFDQEYENEVELYSAEFQQIFAQPRHTTIIGGRVQTGEFNTRNKETDLVDLLNVIGGAGVGYGVTNDFRSDFNRLNFYAYHHWQIARTLRLIGGISLDWLEIPDNIRAAPLQKGENWVNQVSPKLGFIWTPGASTTIRAAYTRALGGFGLDQSYQLEPTQVAGFNQAFRSLIPESVSGALAAAEFETYGISFEEEFGSGTYLGLGGELLKSEVDRNVGAIAFDVSSAPGTLTPSSARQELDFEELTLVATLNQLLSDEWALGARYQASYAQLETDFTDLASNIPTTDGFRIKNRIEGLLHQLTLYSIFNHSSGFFAQSQAAWYAQDNNGYADGRDGEDFWQFHVFAGYRFLNRRAEVRVGLLNITDRDYRLSPLNLHTSPPRDRSLTASLRLSF